MFFVFVESFSVIFPAAGVFLSIQADHVQDTRYGHHPRVLYCTLDSTRAACVVCSSHCY